MLRIDRGIIMRKYWPVNSLMGGLLGIESFSQSKPVGKKSKTFWPLNPYFSLQSLGLELLTRLLMKADLTKQELYESVKTLVEGQDGLTQLTQQKLFTLTSIAFQYLLYCSTKEKGIYLIRIEDGQLADKLAKKAKDPTTRSFISNMLVSRRLSFQGSTFILDYFHPGSWTMTQELPQARFKGGMLVRNTTRAPLAEGELELKPEELVNPLGFIPKLIVVAHDFPLPNAQEVHFPFIKEEEDVLDGVKLSEQLEFDD